jgi:hypothetical protein
MERIGNSNLVGAGLDAMDGSIGEGFIAQKAYDGAEFLSARGGAFTGNDREEKSRPAAFGMTGLCDQVANN